MLWKNLGVVRRCDAVEIEMDCKQVQRLVTSRERFENMVRAKHNLNGRRLELFPLDLSV